MRASLVLGTILLSTIPFTACLCSPCDKSIALYFPNDQARMATQRIQVGAYNPDTGGAGAGMRDCMTDFLGMAKQGKPPLGSPVLGEFKYPFSGDEDLPKVPAGRQIVYVLGYSSSDADAPPTLEGCTDKFDSKGGGDQCNDVPVDLAVVLPDSARLVKVAGDKQVGREGQMLAVPLTVRVDAESPATMGTFSIPGVKVSFTAMDPDFALAGATMNDFETVTDATGQASVQATLPNKPKTGTVIAKAPQLIPKDKPNPMCGDGSPAEQCFNLSVTALPSIANTAVVAGPTGEVPVAVALGQITGDPTSLDLALVTCAGDSNSCAPGAGSVPPQGGSFGATKIYVYGSLASSPTQLNVTSTASFGILPAGVAVGDLIKDPGGTRLDEVAVVNSRRADCQGRVCQKGVDCGCYGVQPGAHCPCEGAEVLVFKKSGSNMVLDQRTSLTASNAVGIAALVSEGGSYLNLAIVAQGRTITTTSPPMRPCNMGNRCLPYDDNRCLFPVQTDQYCLCDADPSHGCEGVVCAPGSTSNCICMVNDPQNPNQNDPCNILRHPELSGCPPGERCECPGCEPDAKVGVCVPRDKMVDILANRWNTVSGGGACSAGATNGTCPDPTMVCQGGTCVHRSFLNRGGCQNPSVRCNNSNNMVPPSKCECLDAFRLNTCSTVTDGCGCKIPDRVIVGDVDAPTLPFGIMAGPIDTDTDWNIIVPSVGGLELIEAHPTQHTFMWKGSPIINSPIHQGVVLSLDDSVDKKSDAAWIARQGDPAKPACLTGMGSNFEQACPTFRPPPMGMMARGCVGVYYTSLANDMQGNLFSVRTPESGGCRRYHLPFAPDGICGGDFNGDGHQDVAIASRETNKLSIMNGDGLGGLLDPPFDVDLPTGAVGGPVACGDIDRDGRDDVVVVNALTGSVYVMRSMH
jgi:hypothetical protein